MKPEKQSILKTHVHYLRSRFLNQKQNVKKRAHIFKKIKNTGGWK